MAARDAKMWAVVVVCHDTEWIATWTIRTTRKEAISAFENFTGDYRRERRKGTARVARIVVSEEAPHA